MDIKIIEKLENVDINIIDIINNYKTEIENYEHIFFDNLKKSIDKNFLNIYFDIDFSTLYNEKIQINDKIKLLNDNNLEIYDIEMINAIIIKKIKNNYYYKWSIFKQNIFENKINSQKINILKNILNNKKNNIFTLHNLLNISNEYNICLHCIALEYIENCIEKNDFIHKLMKKIL